MFGNDFDRVIKKIKEDSWSDGQNQWSSEHDQWANESAPAGQFKSKQEVIDHFVKQGKSAAAGASAWERGWRGYTPKAKKPTGPLRNYHDDMDDKRYMSDDAKVARKPLKTFPELADMLHISGHNLVAIISHYPGFPAPAEGVSARYGSRKYYDVDKFKAWVRQHGIHTRLKNKMGEGYTVVPGFDKERYQERPGLEGPFHTKSGKVVYYDKNEGKYYDPDTDMYIEYDDWQAMNEEGVAEGEFTIADDPDAHIKVLFLKTINGNEYRLVKQGDVYKIYVNRSRKNKQTFPTFNLAKRALQQLLLNAVHTNEQGVAEAEGTPEGLPHLTKELLSHIVQQVGTEGAHAVVKSLEWGDGAAKELLHLIVKDLKNNISMAESVKQRLDKSCWKGYHKAGTKIKGGTRVNNCVPNESVDVEENFADGKNPGRKGLAKRSGVNTKASVSSLRKTAKNSTGEKQRMAHWLANMKAGKAKKDSVSEVSKNTLKNYVKANAEDQLQRASSDSFKSGAKGDKYNTADVTPKDVKRQKGMDRALDKLTKEDAGFDYNDSTSPVGGHINENSDAVYGAIIRRIIGGHRSLISKYGIEAVEEAAREVADWTNIGPDDEIGTSDVSGWVRQVFQALSGNVPVNELSTDALARYKTAAGKAASAADQAGDYAKGHKRFKGVVKATNKQFANDMKKYKDK